MSQSLSQIYLHIIFATKERIPFIKENIESELFSFIGGTIKNLNGFPHLINGTSDHIHILASSSKSVSLTDFLKKIKHDSSLWIKNKGGDYSDFAWQRGYGVFSVSSSRLQVVKKYIANQKEHHKEETVEEEFAKFFKEYRLNYNSQFFWK